LLYYIVIHRRQQHPSSRSNLVYSTENLRTSARWHDPRQTGKTLCTYTQAYRLEIVIRSLFPQLPGAQRGFRRSFAYCGEALGNRCPQMLERPNYITVSPM